MSPQVHHPCASLERRAFYDGHVSCSYPKLDKVMTDYFDKAEREIRERAREGSDPIGASRCVEARVVRDVLLCTGDREFPDDLREKILTRIVASGLVDYSGKPRANGEAEDYAASTRSSDLLGRLHSLFHELARRRHPTRFGPWSDSPEGNLYRRRATDEEDLRPR